MAMMEAWSGWRGAFRGRVEARIGIGVDGQRGIGRHVEGSLGGLSLGDQLGQDQRFHFAHCLVGDVGRDG